MLAVGSKRLEELEEIPHRPTAADDSSELVALLELRAQVGVLGLQPPLFERAVQRVHQLFELERLGDEVRCASLDHAHGITHGAVAGDDDGDDVGVPLDSGVNHLDAVHAGQTQISDEDIEGELRQCLDGSFAGLGLHHDESVILQALGHRLAQWRLVFDEEQVGCAFRHLGGVSILTISRMRRQGERVIYSPPRESPILLLREETTWNVEPFQSPRPAHPSV